MSSISTNFRRFLVCFVVSGLFMLLIFSYEYQIHDRRPYSQILPDNTPPTLVQSQSEDQAIVQVGTQFQNYEIIRLDGTKNFEREIAIKMKLSAQVSSVVTITPYITAPFEIYKKASNQISKLLPIPVYLILLLFSLPMIKLTIQLLPVSIFIKSCGPFFRKY